MRLFVVLLAAAALSAQERQVGQGVNFYSREKEAVLGAQLAQELQQKTTSLDSAVVRDFVEQIGRSLAAQLPGPSISFTFAVVTNQVGGPTHEPLSVPGGYIFVPASLILAARNEAECAGMVGHAMAHVAERHSTRLATGLLAARNHPNVPYIPLAFVGGWAAMPGGLETEADLLAIKTTSAAGYDPTGLVLYISRTQTEDSAGPKTFSSLPPRASRMAHMVKAIQGLPCKTYSSSDEFLRIQGEVRRLMSQLKFL